MAKVLSNSQQALSLSCDAQQQSSRIPYTFLPTIGIKEIPPVSDHKFFQQAVEKQLELGPQIFFHVVPPAANPKLVPITDYACIFPSEGVAFLEANRILCTSNKESMATLLDLAEDRGCHTIVVCIDRSNEACSAIARSFSEIGFRLLAPTSLKVGDYLLMVTEI